MLTRLLWPLVPVWPLVPALLFAGTASAGRTTAASGLTVTVVKDKCGANVRETPAAKVALRAKPIGTGRLRLDVSEFVYYCDPGPQFVATMANGVIRVVPAAPPKNSPRSKCACAHRLRLRVHDVGPGSWKIRLDTGETAPKLGPDGWVNEKIEVVTRVTMPP